LFVLGVGGFCFAITGIINLDMDLTEIALEDERCRESLTRIIEEDTFDVEDWRYVVTPTFTSDDYLVSDQGRVISLPRYRDYDVDTRSRVKHRKFLPGRTMQPGTQPSGHQTIAIIHKKTPFRTHVHRLVAWAFLGPQPTGYHVRHLDGNPSNNCLANLEYGTPWNNITDSFGPAGSSGIGIVIGASLERRLKAAIDGQSDPVSALREIQELLERSRGNL
jgi:hypothetical protein